MPALIGLLVSTKSKSICHQSCSLSDVERDEDVLRFNMISVWRTHTNTHAYASTDTHTHTLSHARTNTHIPKIGEKERVKIVKVKTRQLQPCSNCYHKKSISYQQSFFFSRHRWCKRRFGSLLEVHHHSVKSLFTSIHRSYVINPFFLLISSSPVNRNLLVYYWWEQEDGSRPTVSSIWRRPAK